ncbi:winged helix-turn-helix domain-containing protein [Fictibacillus sp. KIGAM418]|uniref:Winged helix-turn-helix domain-containing protein n=2 Tax=Fictibacillus marinisediminis TaxID=2878389 RepID=A0A9X1XFT7_9BACL|nr:winged helix-turn-helix domain-containing protein [Fictibacillus marinisediminis]MCK6258833.1 winged helix-turn-helix domain-containing protein [Fictibacillus marinisediminis]
MVQSNVAEIASIVSESSRAAILTVLMDGRFHTASELACMAGIKPQTASFHLSKMQEAGVIAQEKQGRHRYYGIHNQEVAKVMESFLLIAPPVKIKSLKQSLQDKAMRFARTCYDHLAGSVGVQLTDALLDAGVLREDHENFSVTEKGEGFFSELGISLERVSKKRRSFSHRCLDWSERRHHLAGALGQALLERLLELGWIQRVPQIRAVKITEEGKKGLKETFGMDLLKEGT